MFSTASLTNFTNEAQMFRKLFDRIAEGPEQNRKVASDELWRICAYIGYH